MAVAVFSRVKVAVDRAIASGRLSHLIGRVAALDADNKVAWLEPDSVLTHYTRSLRGLANILDHGFAWAPNPRDLADLLPAELSAGGPFGATEPEQFGMISFTDHAPPAQRVHRRRFGNYGIVVDRQWATDLGARPVEYVPTAGEQFELLRETAARAFEDCKSRTRFKDDGMWRFGYYSARSASAIQGSRQWAGFLQRFKFMEPDRFANQGEWRLVHPVGVGNLPRTKEHLIANVSPPQGWGKHVHVLPIPVEQVVALVVPALRVPTVRSFLPARFRGLRVVPALGL